MAKPQTCVQAAEGRPITPTGSWLRNYRPSVISRKQSTGFPLLSRSESHCTVAIHTSYLRGPTEEACRFCRISASCPGMIRRLGFMRRNIQPEPGG